MARKVGPTYRWRLSEIEFYDTGPESTEKHVFLTASLTAVFVDWRSAARRPPGRLGSMLWRT
jgi:hypothetical protein